MSEFRFALSRDDALYFGVRPTGSIRVDHDGTMLAFKPDGQDGIVVVRDRHTADRQSWMAQMAATAPNLVAKGILLRWIDAGRQMLNDDLPLVDVEPELARAAAALDTHGDAVNSRRATT
jgi:hypothetical protein